MNKAQAKLIEVGREVEDAAKESEREIDEITRQAWHDIEEKRAKFQAMEVDAATTDQPMRCGTLTHNLVFVSRACSLMSRLLFFIFFYCRENIWRA